MSHRNRVREQAGRHPAAEPEETGASAPAAIRLHPCRAGQWIEAAEMHRWAAEQIAPGHTGDIAIDLSGLEHLDASALQILLGLRAGLGAESRALHCEHASEHLRTWFEYAGAGDLLALPGSEPHREAEEPLACAKF